MLKKQPKPPEFGVCAMLDAYADKVTPDDSSRLEIHLFMRNTAYKAKRVWNASTAVPSTQCLVYPVAHPTMCEEKAFLEHSDNKTMWDLSTEYGQNRQQYLEFMSDYLEEAWK